MPSNHLILCCPLLLLPSIFPSIGVFSNVSDLPSGGQRFGLQHQGWFPLGLTGLISLLSKGLSRVFSSTAVWRHQFFGTQPFYCQYMTTGKTIALMVWTFVGKVISVLFNMLSRFVIIFLPKSKHLLISCLLSPSTVTLETKKIKSFTVSPSICHKLTLLSINFHKQFHT